MYQPVTVVTPQGQVVTQALSPGTIRIQNSQVRVPFLGEGLGVSGAVRARESQAWVFLCLKTVPFPSSAQCQPRFLFYSPFPLP